MATAKFILQLCGWLIGIPLEILVIRALLRGPFRQYPLVFFYVLLTFLSTLVELPFNIQSGLVGSEDLIRLAAKIYWVNEWILQVLGFAMVLSLIDLAISTSQWRRILRAGLAGGTILIAGVTFLMYYRPPPAKFGSWMTPWTQDLSVCATALDLLLWMLLIASRNSDRRLLLISGALGMQFTGETISAAMLKLSMRRRIESLALAGSLVAMLADLACLYVWWQTFRAKPERKPSPPRT